MDMLTKIFAKQYELNKRIFAERHGTVYGSLCNHRSEGATDEDRAKWILNYNRAQIHESIELEDELNWKWWKDGKEIDWDAVRMELIDELHFWVSKCQIAGLTPKILEELYEKKNKLNHVRQDKGYGGNYKKYDADGVEDNKRIDDLI